MGLKKPTLHIVFSKVEGHFMVSEEDMMKMSSPKFVGGTARSKVRLLFPINSDKYNSLN